MGLTDHDVWCSVYNYVLIRQHLYIQTRRQAYIKTYTFYYSTIDRNRIHSLINLPYTGAYVKIKVNILHGCYRRY